MAGSTAEVEGCRTWALRGVGIVARRRVNAGYAMARSEPCQATIRGITREVVLSVETVRVMFDARLMRKEEA